MRLAVLVPSHEYRSYAGARIRYNRLAPELASVGIELTLENIGQFDPTTSTFDAVLISKCYDARSLIAAAAASQRGKLVGVDLFDDYFSDASDSRLVRYRGWLTQLLPLCDFALCSTAAMSEVVALHRPGLATHVVNDPAPTHHAEGLGLKLTDKLDAARNGLCIRVAWFGIGDNPYFPVGLSDLASYGAAIGDLARSGFSVELTVLTNRRALTAEGLALVGDLPVATRIEEWSETAEEELLGQALVACLPVSAQPFSIAKSLNRAFTALTAGCQVLSLGYPLYAALEPLIYRDPAELVADLLRGPLRLSPASMDSLLEKIHSFASAEREARRLADFLTNIRADDGDRSSRLYLVHGHSSPVESHRMVREANGLSVASPYCSAGLDFDVLFRGAGANLRMLVSRDATRNMLPEITARLKPNGNGGTYLCVGGDADKGSAEATQDDWSNEPLAFQLATYGRTMQQIEGRLAEAFGPGRTFLSEVSPLPFSGAGAS